DPLINTAKVDCTVDGFGNKLHAEASHSVNLFQPGVAITKEGDTLSKVGDDVNYTIKVTNTATAHRRTLTCTLSHALPGISTNLSPAPGGTDISSPTLPAAPPISDPLINTAKVDCTVDGFGNKLHAEASHSVNLFQPCVQISKTGDQLSKIGDDVNYAIKVT